MNGMEWKGYENVLKNLSKEKVLIEVIVWEYSVRTERMTER